MGIGQIPCGVTDYKAFAFVCKGAVSSILIVEYFTLCLLCWGKNLSCIVAFYDLFALVSSNIQ